MNGSGSTILWNTPTSLRSIDNKRMTFIRTLKVLGVTVYKKFFEISTDEFFNRVKGEKLKLKIINGILEDYMASIERAELAGQSALVEKLKDGVEVVKKEIQIVIAGVNDYLTKKQFEDLLKKTTRGIEVTPIRNFTRHIPNDIVLKVGELRKLGVFEDFIVVHYDPKKENSQLTKEEKRKKEDPIIFGRVKDSDKFYFIADWIDEYCNLTLEEAVKIIGEKQKQILIIKK